MPWLSGSYKSKMSTCMTFKMNAYLNFVPQLHLLSQFHSGPGPQSHRTTLNWMSQMIDKVDLPYCTLAFLQPADGSGGKGRNEVENFTDAGGEKEETTVQKLCIRLVYFVMFLGGSQDIVPRPGPAQGLALLAWPMWICARSPGCRGEAVPLQLVLKTQVWSHTNTFLKSTC